MKCSECGEELKRADDWEEITSAGYFSPPRHNHDDNCLTRHYICKNGHPINISKRRRCYTLGCPWIGKYKCFCRASIKVDKWPGQLPPPKGDGLKGLGMPIRNDQEKTGD